MATAKDRDLQKEFDSLKDDLAAIREDIKNLTAAGGSAASDALSDAKAKLETEAQKLISNLEETAGGLKQEGQKVVKDVEKQVETNPVTSLLTTLGIGFALGWLISRK